MKKMNLVWVVIVLTAFLVAGAFQPLPLLAQALTISDVKFHDNWKDPGKPQKGAFAAKWWNGRQAQIMCYNDESRQTLPAAMLQEMLSYLSNNRPNGTEADKENARYKLFLTTAMTYPAAHTKSTVAPAPAKVAAAVIPLPKVEQTVAPTPAPATPREEPDLQTQINAMIKGKLAKPMAAAAPAKTKAAKKTAKAPVAKDATKVCASAKEVAGYKEKIQKLEADNKEWDAAYTEMDTKLKACDNNLKNALANLNTEKNGRNDDKIKANKALLEAKDSGYALKTMIWVCLAALVLGFIAGGLTFRRKRSSFSEKQ